MNEVTRMLQAARQGPPGANEKLLAAVYEELRGMARHKMASEAPGHLLQPTALVNEAWLRLRDATPWENRAHFFASAGEAMRRILVDEARKRHAARRGGGGVHVSLEDQEIAATPADEQILAVHDALDELAIEDPQCANLVKLRYFAGMKMEEAATALNLPLRTGERLWTFARTWLRQKIGDGKGT